MTTPRQPSEEDRDRSEEAKCETLLLCRAMQSYLLRRHGIPARLVTGGLPHHHHTTSLRHSHTDPHGSEPRGDGHGDGSS